MSSQLKLSAYGALATMATSLSLLSVFASTAWVMPVMVAIVLVAGCCALVRMSPLPSAFEPILAAVAVLLWVTIIDAHSKAHFGVIPGRLAFSHLGHVARSGFTEIHRLPAPAPAHHGLVLLTVVGVAAIALVVDLLTVTLRRAALSGLPLLALFTVCAATGHHGVGIFPFIVASIGYLWLLYADNREKVARWGAAVGTGKRARPASAWSTDAASAPAPASLGRQVGAVAISLGLVIPLFIPGLHTGIGKNGGGGSGGSGSGGSVRTFDPLVRIGADLSTSAPEPVLSYRTSSQDPTYLRMTSLDVFNGSSFSLPQLTASAKSEASEQLPVTPPQGPIVTTSINIAPKFDVRWLPVVATALGVSVGSDWRYDPGTSTIFSAATDTEGLHYSVRSVVNQPSGEALSTAPAPDQAHDADMGLTDISPAVKALTRRVTAGATTRYAAALDIERFFTTGHHFTYDTNIAPDHSSHALDDFLLHTRRGFCQQYAAAMAVMARLKGIPSRVAVGFTRGKQQANGTWVVTTHDAHAWPELWFQGFGWLPFEPTPRADGQAVTPPYAKPSTHHGGSVKNPKQHGKDSNGPGRTPAGLLRKPPGSGGRFGGTPNDVGGSSGASRIALALWILALVVAVALVVPGTARVITRQRRQRRLNDPAEAAPAAWEELRDTAIDYRVPWDDRRSPRQVATGLREALGAAPQVRAALLGIVRAEEESRYAPTPQARQAELRRDLGVVRSAMSETCTRSQRVFASLMPRSTVLVGRLMLSRLASSLEKLSRRQIPIRWPLRRKGLART